MNLEKNKKFQIDISIKKQEGLEKTNLTNNKINDLKNAVKLQYDEIISFQNTPITKENKQDLENIILATQDLISNCISDKTYSGNRDQNFGNLTFLCHEISLRMETYKLEEKIKELDYKNKIIDRNQKN